ncbi:MAG TPA: helix-turn-helix transcriptional regulator [Solirubrobacteraceae bacterium]|nr:helix-turn-helix transcriptional regulator [Solirubrobacteraceae bacterium]
MRSGATGERQGANGERQGANGERRRVELADFLRTKRSSLQPEDVGLPDGGRRRTPGLRREEVALLAGVGTTWYTWLEQGRDVRASLDVLEALSRALRLTGAERAHLILLGRGEQAKPCKAPAEEVSPNLRRLVENVGPGPAYLLGRRWDYLAWNRSFEAVFGWEPGPDPLTRNHVWLWFMDPSRRSLCSGDWAASARLLVAKFRGDSAKNIGDPAFEELISVLNGSSPEFRKLWKRHEVAGSGDGHKELTHPVAGPLAFDHAVFHHGESGEQRLILYTPSCEHDTRAKLARLLRDEHADSRELELALAVG